MKSLNKKSIKERRLVRAAAFICFTFIMVFVSMMFARGEPTKAGTPSEFKAFCWEDREKFFKLLDTGSESNAPKYSLYQAKFKRDNPTVYLESGKPIHLDELCNGDRNSDRRDNEGVPPYRYWFWVRANKKASTSITWRTDSYIATGEPIDESVYNAKEYVNSDKVVSVAIDRKSAKSRNNSFYVNNGKVVNGYELDFYIIDIKEWYNKGGAYDENGAYADGFHGYLYMQSVIGVYHSGKFNKGPYYTLGSWKGAEGWSDKAKKTLGNGSQSTAQDTDGYVTKMKWEEGSNDLVELHVYYLMYATAPPGDEETPKTTSVRHMKIYAACNHCLRTFPKPVSVRWTGILTEMNIINIF
ncbi:MAG: hypothetical protein K2K35_11515 [Lachnospiraceae bacterium]|nr:hypothetical protein [Lachnospiraceae bacterium]